MVCFKKVGFIFLLLANTLCFAGDLERILDLYSLSLRVHRLVELLSVTDAKLLNPESARIFETIDVQVENDIQKHLGMGDFPVVFSETDSSVEESIKRSRTPTTVKLLDAYELKEKLSELKPYDHAKRIIYDFEESPLETLKINWVSFAKAFRKHGIPLTDEMWKKFIWLAIHAPQADSKNEIYPLAFHFGDQMSPELRKKLIHAFPLFDYLHLSLTQKYSVAAMIFNADQDLLPKLVEYFKIDENGITSVKAVLNESFTPPKSKNTLAGLKLSISDLVQSKPDITQQFSLYKYLRSTLINVIEPGSSEWAEVKEHLIQSLNVQTHALVRDQKIPEAIKLLTLNSELDSKNPLLREDFLNLLKEKTHFSELLLAAPKTSPLYPEYYSDILAEARLHRSSASAIRTFFLYIPLTPFQSELAKFDLQFVVDDLLANLKNELNSSYFAQLNLIRSLSSKKKLTSNIKFFFDALFEQEAQYLSLWKNREYVESKTEKKPHFYFRRDTRIRDFILNPQQMPFFNKPEHRSLIAISILNAYHSFPSDLVPEAALSSLLSDAEFRLSHQTLIEEVISSVIIHHQYEDDPMKMIKKGASSVPLQNLLLLVSESGPETLLSNLALLRKVLKKQEESEHSELRENVITEISRHIHEILENSGDALCPILLTTWN